MARFSEAKATPGNYTRSRAGWVTCMEQWRTAVGKTIELKAKDGFTLAAYRADPAGKPKGGLVVIQEIFGATHHMRGVTARFPPLGYPAIQPARFAGPTLSVDRA